MKPDKFYVEQKFSEFNSIFFQGKLPVIPIKMSNARSFLGKIVYKYKRDLSGKIRYYDFEMRISNKLDRAENVVEDTIIHEMIHLWIMWNQWCDTSAHGKIFKSVMNDINFRYNRNITIRYKAPSSEIAADKESKMHIICVAKLDNGSTGIIIPAKSRILEFRNTIQKIPQISQCEWVYTRNPFFNKYPRVRTIKIYYLSVEEIFKELSDSKRIIEKNSTLYLSSDSPVFSFL